MNPPKGIMRIIGVGGTRPPRFGDSNSPIRWHKTSENVGEHILKKSTYVYWGTKPFRK